MNEPNQPREWWLNLHASYEKGFYSENPSEWMPSTEGQLVHVVEYSAYEQAIKEAERLNIQAGIYSLEADKWKALAEMMAEALGDLVHIPVDDVWSAEEIAQKALAEFDAGKK